MDANNILQDLRVIYKKVNTPRGRMIKALAEQYNKKKISSELFVSLGGMYVRNNKHLLSD